MSRDPLIETTRMLEQTAHGVQKLLAQKFPASGGHPYPDASGNVRVAERHGSDCQTAASAYEAAVMRLAKLAVALRSAALLEARAHQSSAGKRLSLYRQDDATASCIALLLWSLHAWILELRLVMALADEAEESVVKELDARLEKLVRPGDVWLELEISGPGRQVCVACAPADSMAVGVLAWPYLLGARRPAPAASRLRAGLRVGQGVDGAWLRLGNRFAEIPSSVSPCIMQAATRAAPLLTSPPQPGRWAG